MSSLSRRVLAAVGAAAVTLAWVAIPSSATVSPTAPVIIDEVYGGGGNSGSYWKSDFVVLYNTTDAAVDLSGWSLQYASAANPFTGLTALTGSIAAHDTFLIKMDTGTGGTTDLPTPDLTGTASVSSTTGKFALVQGATPIGTCVAATSCSLRADVIDYVGWGTAGDYAGSAAALATSNTTSIKRVDHANTADNLADFVLTNPPTPRPSTGGGTPTTPPPTTSPTPTGPPTTPPDTATISGIQGTKTTAGLTVGTAVTTSGIVTATYPTGGLNGFVIQEPGTGGAIDLATWAGSKAVFVYLGTGSIGALTGIAVGDLVSVTGAVADYAGLTEVNVTSAANVIKLTPAVTPDPVLPITTAWPTSEADRHAIESMLYQPTGTFTVTNNYDTNRYGSITLASGTKPLMQPTDVVPSSDAAGIAAIEADNAARGVVLDDASTLQYTQAANSGLTPPYISNTNPVRVGAAVTFTKPVIVDLRNSAWTLNPTERVMGSDPADWPISAVNTRTSAPDAAAIADHGTPDFKIASFNVLNYFPTTGDSWTPACTSYSSRLGEKITVNTCPGDGPRGAWDEANLQRQQDKIVAAINALDADVVGLMEIENSVKLGKSKDSGVATLVAALNTAAGTAAWSYVPSPTATLPPVAQQDVITVAMIYKAAAVTPLGTAQSIPDASAAGQPFNNAREPLAQAFTPAGGGEPFVVIVNHLKSKGSGDAPDADAPLEGNANTSRVAQAGKLISWISGTVLPSYSSPAVTDVFLAGDFNAYAQEKPMLALYAAGYKDIETALDLGKQSYSYSGLSGSLDHVLANPSALERVTGADIWSINSGESIAMEYSRYDYHGTNYYQATPYRSSDHDPVVVGVRVTTPTEVDLTLLNINDFHGRIDDNTVNFAATIEKLRAAGGEANTALLSAGDNIGASLFASAYQEDFPTLDVLAALNLRASAVGNHEFDRGWSDLDGRVVPYTSGDFPYLGANVYLAGTTKAALPEYTVITLDGGVRVAVIGVVTQETPTLVSPAGVAMLEFGDPVTAVNRVAQQIVDGDLADIIVAEYHDGAPEDDPTGTTLAAQMAISATLNRIVTQTSAAVDVIFTGHTHKRYAWEAPVPGAATATRPIIQTSSYGAYIGKVTLTYDKAAGEVTAYTVENVPVTAASAADLSLPRVAAVKTIVDDALAAATAAGSVVIGHVSAPITTAYSGGAYTGGIWGGGARDDRSEASTLGLLVSNAMRDKMKEIDNTVAFGVTNPGGLRAELNRPGGDITIADARAVLPFNNTLAIVTLNGAQVITMLEQQWQRDAAGNLPSRAYLQLGLSDDVTYTYSEADATCISTASGSPVAVACKQGSVTSVMIDGVPIDPAADYKIATFTFLADGGDNFWVFQDHSAYVDTGMLDYEGWIAYLTAASVPNPIAPNFARAGVRVEGLPASLTEADSITFDVAKLNVMSAGSPSAGTVAVSLAGHGLGTFPVAEVGGSASIAVTLPDGVTGNQLLELVGADNGTHVSIPVSITAKSSPTTPPTSPPTSTTPTGTSPTPTATGTATGTGPTATGTGPTVPSPTTDGPGTGGTLTLDKVSVAAGGGVTASIVGGPAGLGVQVILEPGWIVVGEVTLDGSGNGTVVLAIPADTAPGTYNIWVLGDGIELVTPLTVRAAGPETPGPEGTGTPTVPTTTPGASSTTTGTSAGGKLPFTGTHAFSTLMVGIAFIVGGALICAGWRRKEI